MGWTNDQPFQFLFPPGGSLSAPHRLIGPLIPAVLTSFSADYTWQFVDLWYFDATNFVFDALAYNIPNGIHERITGTYDPTNGVQLKVIMSGIGDAFLNAYYFGSDFYATTNKLVVEFRNANVIVDNLSTFNTENGVLNDGTAEVWHNVTLLVGWTQRGGGTTTLKVRRLPGGVGLVQVAGAINAGTKADGTTIFTLPSGYAPAAQISLPVSCDTQVLAQAPHLDFNADGTVKCWGLSSASFLSISQIYPLGSV